MDRKYTFDDFLLVPDYTLANSQIDITTDFFGFRLEVPVISSPMDTITGIPMMNAMKEAGGWGIHHRYCDYELLAKAFPYGGIAVSPSMKLECIEKILDTMEARYAPILVLDVAHGHTKRNLDFCEKLVELGADVVSGNICTPSAAIDYYNVGVKYLRVGVGAGSVCTTRLVTGVGYPQASALDWINDVEFRDEIRIISDGGHRNSGDIVKAFACGADFVMLGGMLAGTDECCGLLTKEDIQYSVRQTYQYRGMASGEALRSRKNEFFVEGTAKIVQPKGSVKYVLEQIKDALIQACYYTGCNCVSELRQVSKVFLSDGSMRESYIR